MIARPVPPDDRSVRPLIVTALLAASCVVVIALLVTALPQPGFDAAILRSLRHADDLRTPIGPPLLLDAMRDLTSLGSVSVTLLIMVLGMGGALLRRRASEALLLLCAIGGGTAVVNAVKLVVRRVRPDVVPHLTTEATFSFPSSHAATALLTYGVLAVLTARAAPDVRPFAIVVAAALALIVGFSRMYLGVHFPSDVLAGWFLGLAWLAGCTAVFDARTRVRRPRSPTQH